MTEENRNVPTDGAHSSGIKLPDGASGDAPRKINPIPAVHTTGGGEDIKLPEAQADIISDAGAPRFIKTGNVPKVTVRPEAQAETEVDRFTDRFSVRPQQRSRTGYTGKIRTYADTHAAPADRMKRMISTEGENAAETDEAVDMLEAKRGGFVFNAEDAETVETVHISKENADEIKRAAAEREAGATKELPDDAEPRFSADENETPTRKIPVKGELLREIAGTASDDVPLDPDQLMMDGYDGDDEEEDGAREEALRRARAKKINNFNFWNKSNGTEESADEKFSSGSHRELPPFFQRLADRFAGLDSSFTPVKSTEYRDPEDRKAVFSSLIKTRNACLLRAGVLALIGIILFIVDAAVAVSASKNGGFFTVLGGNSLVYNILNTVFLLSAAVILLPELKTGLFSLLKIHPKADTSLLFMFVSAALQNGAMYSNAVRAEYDMHLFTPAVILLSVPFLMSKLFFYDSMRQCFKAVSAKSDKSYLRKVSDVRLVRELLRDSDADEDINVVYAGKTKFIGTFLGRGADSANAGMPASRLVLICAAASVVLGIAAGFVGKSFAAATTAMTLAALCSFPVSCLVSLGKTLANENKKLSLKSSFVQSYADARDFSCVDDIVIDDADVIRAEVTKCISAKNVKEKQAMFVAGALTSVSGGLMKKAFASAVHGFEDRMPAVDGLVYEDKLGVSAWVSGCKILLGTHTLLVNHNVGVPDESVVNALIEDGAKPVYLAIEGNFAALFSVKYSLLPGVAGNLGELADNGANILISTVDPNITDAYAEELLGLPADSVRTLAKKVSDKLNSSRTAVTDSEEAGIVFGDSVESLCRCAAAAIRLDSAKRISKLICAGASVFGLVIAAFLVFTGAYAKTSAIIPIVLQAIFTAFCIASPALFANTSKPRRRKALKKDVPDDVFGVNGSDGETAFSGGRVESTENEASEENTVSSRASSAGGEKPVGDGGSVNSAPPTADNADDDGDDPISAETYSALDAFAEEQERAERRSSGKTRFAATSAASADTAESDDDSDGEVDSEKESADLVSSIVSKAKKLFGGILRKTESETESEADDDTDGETEAPDGHGSDAAVTDSVLKADKARTASVPAAKREGILIPETGKASRRTRKTFDTAEDIEAAYKRKKDEDERVRSIFTAPEIPDAPHYDIGAKPAEEAKFVPPTNTGSINVFDDSVFSPFEDDKIFAGLHDSPPARFDF